MRKYVVFNTDSGNRYLYSDRFHTFTPLPLSLEKRIENNVETTLSQDEDYYRKKYAFWDEYGFISAREMNFTTRPEPEEIKIKLANLKQLVFEVTDACNLKCKYCGYGEMYCNYDKRESVNLSFERVKRLLDYMVSLWNSSYNLSFNNVIDIAFYGGEPLLNMRLIKQTIDYIEANCTSNLVFTYRMTTNAILLYKYMDYLVSKKFSILISLDGDEYANSYRVAKNGKESFTQVLHSIHALKEKYPDFFAENVDFNAVLHDRNSYASAYSFIKDNFGKVPMVSELNESGIRESQKERFKQMFKSTYSEQKQFYYQNQSARELFAEPLESQARSLIHGYTGNTYKSLNELLKKENETRHLPSGTCLAFYKKVFLTVNGKIFPCEKIGQEHPLGFVDEQSVKIDFEYIAGLYDKMYKPLLKLCSHCFFQSNCSQCIFNILDKSVGGRFYCSNFASKRSMADYLRENVSHLEDKPSVYHKIVQKDLLV